jgi:hypothetical protein
MAAAGFTAVSVDVATLGVTAKDQLAAFYDRGGHLWLGVVPTDRPDQAGPTLDGLLRPTLRLLDDLGADPADGRVTLTPACGLAGFSRAGAMGVGRALDHLARAVDESAGE